MLQLVVDNPHIPSASDVAAKLADINGPRFRLRHPDGKYLHFNLDRFTAERGWRWEGTGNQLSNLQEKFPEVCDGLTVVEVAR